MLKCRPGTDGRSGFIVPLVFGQGSILILGTYTGYTY